MPFSAICTSALRHLAKPVVNSLANLIAFSGCANCRSAFDGSSHDTADLGARHDAMVSRIAPNGLDQ
jgi:hypothetical protein